MTYVLPEEIEAAVPGFLAGEAPEPLYPNVTLALLETEGNALFILAEARRLMDEAGMPENEVARFLSMATSSDYKTLLKTVVEWVQVPHRPCVEGEFSTPKREG